MHSYLTNDIQDWLFDEFLEYTPLTTFNINLFIWNECSGKSKVLKVEGECNVQIQYCNKNGRISDEQTFSMWTGRAMRELLTKILTRLSTGISRFILV